MMKKLFILMLLAATAAVANAQDYWAADSVAEYDYDIVADTAAVFYVPTFNGIDVDGDIEYFVNALVEDGFLIADVDDDGINLEGVYDDIPVDVVVVPGIENRVATVGMVFPACESFNQAKLYYNYLVDMGNVLYGDPSIVTEDLTEMSKDELIAALSNGTLNYRTIYIYGDYFISMSITAGNEVEGKPFKALWVIINSNNIID